MQAGKCMPARLGVFEVCLLLLPQPSESLLYSLLKIRTLIPQCLHQPWDSREIIQGMHCLGAGARDCSATEQLSAWAEQRAYANSFFPALFLEFYFSSLKPSLFLVELGLVCLSASGWDSLHCCIHAWKASPLPPLLPLQHSWIITELYTAGWRRDNPPCEQQEAKKACHGFFCLILWKYYL